MIVWKVDHMSLETEPTPGTTPGPFLPGPGPVRHEHTGLSGPQITPQVRRPIAPTPPVEPMPVQRSTPSGPGLVRQAIRWLAIGIVVFVAGAGGYIAYDRVTNHPASSSAPRRQVTPSATTTVTGPARSVASTVPAEASTLPIRTYARPAYRSATFVESWHEIGTVNGAPLDSTMTIHGTVDYQTPIASLTFDETGTRTRSSTMILTSDGHYTSGEAYGAPWTKSTSTSIGKGMTSIDYLKMYQNVVSADVQTSATDLRVGHTEAGGVPVTTYEFDVDMRKLPWLTTSANAALLNDDLLRTHVTIAVDAQGLLRSVDTAWNESAWRNALAQAGGDLTWYTHDHIDITSISDTPADITLPPNTVAAPPTTS